MRKSKLKNNAPPRKAVSMVITAAQIRAARAILGLGWSQERLAKESGVSETTIANIERGASKRPSADTMDKLQTALQRGGVEFTNGDQPGVRLRKGGS
jgi:transcriptional regulator with XRE-family HTH domain